MTSTHPTRRRSPRPALARLSVMLLLALPLTLAGCGPSPEEAAAEAAAREAAALAAREAKVAPTLQLYRDARARGDARLALASAEVVLADGPGTAAAAEVAPAIEALRAEAAAQRETARLKALWRYASVAVEGESRAQRSAALHNRPAAADAADAADAANADAPEPGIAAPPRVQLVLRDDPRWGQSVYLVIEAGDFDCGSPCAFLIGFDDAAPRRFAGEASSTGERPALFINDDTGFIRALEQAKTVSIRPARGGAPIVFEIGGFDPLRYQVGA